MFLSIRVTRIYIYDSDGSLKQIETLMPDNSGELANNGKEVYGYDEQGRMNDYESYHSLRPTVVATNTIRKEG